jgi:hypothetical protein
VDFDSKLDYMILAIENVGKTIAQNVQLEFDPLLESSLADTDLSTNSVLVRGIPMLAPGKRLRVLFDRYTSRMESGLPMTLDVKVSYEGPTKKKKTKKYPREPYVLDLEHLKNVMLAEPTVADVLQSGLKEITEALHTSD